MEKPPLPFENLTAGQMEYWARGALQSGDVLSTKDATQVMLWIAMHLGKLEQHIERKLK